MIQGAQKTQVVGVDISLEETSFAIVDVRGNILARDSFNSADYPSIEDYVMKLCDSIMKLIESNNSIEHIRSIGISAPSGNYLSGCIENSPNMPWRGVIPMAAMVRDRLGLAVALANDCHAVALGELAFGSGHGLSNFGVVTIGYGLGSTIISNGQVHTGANGFAGELGHICVVDNGRACNCGRLGCLESYVASSGIVRTARELMTESNKASLLRDLDRLTPKTIRDCCEMGDEMAIEVYRRTGYWLGVGLANFATMFDPEAIILAGGVSQAGRWLSEPAKDSFDNHVFHNIRGRVDLIISQLSNRERDILGASVLAWNVKEYSLFK